MDDSKKVSEFLTEKLKDLFSLIYKSKGETAQQGSALTLPEPAVAYGKFLRIEFDMPHEIFPSDLIRWLSIQEITQKMYWCERDASYEVAGLGHADILLSSPRLFDKINDRLGIKNRPGSPFEQDRSLNPEPSGRSLSLKSGSGRRSSRDKNQQSQFLPVRYYGAIAFNASDSIDDEWKTFGNSYFFVPMLEFINSGNIKIFAVNLFTEDTTRIKNTNLKDIIDSAILLIGRLNFNSNASEISGINAITKPSFKLKIKKRVDNPSKRNWIKNINDAIKTFDKSMLEKIVLSRKTVFKTASSINPFELLEWLRKVNIRTFNFCFQNGVQTAFLGCSPELLYSRKDGRLYSEAVAGTVVSGSTLREEKLFASKLLESEKDGEEYQFVYDSIKKDLNLIGTDFKVESEKEILKLSYAQHIISRFHCNLKDGIDDGHIINVLHPTPAVGGFPKQGIKQHIKKYESFSRGFYAGPIGWISANSSEFVVGIRTSLVNNDILILYSGAGIVKKSVAELEWEEIENKIKPFLGLMQF